MLINMVALILEAIIIEQHFTLSHHNDGLYGAFLADIAKLK